MYAPMRDNQGRVVLLMGSKGWQVSTSSRIIV